MRGKVVEVYVDWECDLPFVRLFALSNTGDSFHRGLIFRSMRSVQDFWGPGWPDCFRSRAFYFCTTLPALGADPSIGLCAAKANSFALMINNNYEGVQAGWIFSHE